MNNLSIIQNHDYTNKTVLLRVDFNIPLNPDGSITDTTRIEAALPTINHLLSQNAKVIIISHLGRPQGIPTERLSLLPVSHALTKFLGREVLLLPLDPPPSTLQSIRPAQVVLLENLRFNPGEETNDPSFSQKLASLADCYVNDAFGTAHRSHASTVGVPSIMNNPSSPPPSAGFLIQKEIEFLAKALDTPPLTVILGGAKVSDKIKIIDHLLDKASTMIIGGAMAYTFSLALGHSIGDSLSEPDKVPLALNAINKAKKLGVKLLLPIDHLVTDHIDFDNKALGNTQTVNLDIPPSSQGIDIGPQTIELFKKEIAKANTILWNGPMGICEISLSANGTNQIAEAVAHSNAISIIGGGDSIKALKASGYSDQVSFISTGGGATLKFLEGTPPLPGLQILSSI